MHNRWQIAILMLMIVSLISGCFGKKEVLEPLQPSKIKVIYQTEEAFDLDYGKYFKMNYPQIEVEVIPKIQVLKNLGKMIIPDEYDSEVRKLLERSGADVLLLDQQNFEQFAANGKLYGIEEAIRQDNYDIEGFMPGLIDVIKNLGDGKLYGLTPAVYNKALRYNTTLFRENQIDPPTNKMTWREVFELGERFSNIKHGDRPVRGVFLDDLRGVGDLMYDIAKTYGLQLFDPKGEKVLINSKGWKEAMSLATDAVRNNVVYFDPVAQLDSSHNLFDDGVAAMTFKGVPHAGEVGFNVDKAPVEWEAVTVPIDPADESTGVYLDSLFAIAADSSNKRAAWEFVKFVCGPEMAHARSKTMDGTLPSRTGYVKEFKGKSMEAFYMLKVKQADSIRQSGRVPFKFFTLFDEPLREELQAVVDNKKSVDEAAAVLEAKAQELLIKARAASTMIVSSMFVTHAGPTFAGAEAAGGKKQEQTSGNSIQVDKKVAANLQKAVNQFAGKESKLKFENAFKHPFDLATVPSADELYEVNFKPGTGELITIKGIQTLDKVSKDEQKELLNKLKGMYAKKAYVFNKEVQIIQSYDKGKVSATLYGLEGKDFFISWIKFPPEQSKNKNYIGATVIQVDKNELEPKLLKTAADAVKTALNQEFEVKKAELGYYGTKGDIWKLKGDHITLAVEAKTGKIEYVYDVARKQADKAVTEKEVKEIVAPIAKKLFNMDIQGLEVKWDKSARDFCFVQNKETKMSVALDADKNVVYMFSGLRMMLEK